MVAIITAKWSIVDCRAYKLYKSRSRNVRVNFFACRVVNVWNSLPDTVSFTSLAALKGFIRTIDFSELLKYNDV